MRDLGRTQTGPARSVTVVPPRGGGRKAGAPAAPPHTPACFPHQAPHCTVARRPQHQPHQNRACSRRIERAREESSVFEALDCSGRLHSVPAAGTCRSAQWVQLESRNGPSAAPDLLGWRDVHLLRVSSGATPLRGGLAPRSHGATRTPPAQRGVAEPTRDGRAPAAGHHKPTHRPRPDARACPRRSEPAPALRQRPARTRATTTARARATGRTRPPLTLLNTFPPLPLGAAERAGLHSIVNLSRPWYGTVVTCGARPGADRAIGRDCLRRGGRGPGRRRPPSLATGTHALTAAMNAQRRHAPITSRGARAGQPDACVSESRLGWPLRPERPESRAHLPNQDYAGGGWPSRLSNPHNP